MDRRGFLKLGFKAVVGLVVGGPVVVRGLFQGMPVQPARLELEAEDLGGFVLPPEIQERLLAALQEKQPVVGSPVEVSWVGEGVGGRLGGVR